MKNPSSPKKSAEESSAVHQPAAVRRPTATALCKIVSGGQTGVDRAALDVALARGLPCGGWCPRGRRAEDGPIPNHYPLLETATEDYPTRTELNVRDTDGTLILTRGRPDGGTGLTRRLARRLGKPCKVVDFEKGPSPRRAAEWVLRHGIAVLNVAGPRESNRPGIHERAARFLATMLDHLEAAARETPLY